MTPVSPGRAGNQLSGVSCASARNCAAVGEYGNPGKTQPQVLPLTEIWNGAGWR